MCIWRLGDEECNIWETECSNSFGLNDGGPNENGIKFCCFCGEVVIPEIPNDVDPETGA